MSVKYLLILCELLSSLPHALMVPQLADGVSRAMPVREIRDSKSSLGPTNLRSHGKQYFILDEACCSKYNKVRKMINSSVPFRQFNVYT